MNINAREFRPTSRASAPVTPARGSTPAPASGAAPPQAGLDRKASGAGHLEGEPACHPVGCAVELRVSSLQPCVESSKDSGAQGLWVHDMHTCPERSGRPLSIYRPLTALPCRLQQLLSALQAGE